MSRLRRDPRFDVVDLTLSKPRLPTPKREREINALLDRWANFGRPRTSNRGSAQSRD